MIDSIKLFWNDIGKRKSFWIPVLFFSISTYGYSVFSRTVGIDDLASDLYIGSGQVMIAAGRWGMNLTNFLAAIPRLSPASDRLLATGFLMIAAILLSGMFYHIHHERENGAFVYKYTVLSCWLIVFPILGEIWEYSGANYLSTGGMMISIASCYYLMTRDRIRVKNLLLAGLFMTLPMSSYESGVMFYITLVCAVLFYQYCIWGDRDKKSLYWKNAFLYAVPLAAAFSLRWLTGNLLRLILGVAKGHNGATGIQWLKDPLSDVFRKLVIDTILNYAVNGIVYLPITLFLLSVFYLIFYCIYQTVKKGNWMIIIGGILLIFSVFFLSLVQGSFMQYRTAIALSMLTGFSAYCLMESFEDKKKTKRIVASCLALYLIWIQSAFLNSELALNNQRSENEMRTMSIIAQKVLSINTEKPVIFLGEYNIGRYFKDAKKAYLGSTAGKLYQKTIDAFINRYGDYYYTFYHLTEFPDSNVNSVINHSIAVGLMENYLAYLGYDIKVIDRTADADAVALAEEIASTAPMRSYDIMETEDFIIVTLELPEYKKSA